MKILSLNIFFIFCFFLSREIYSQTKEWMYRYGTNGIDAGNSIAIDKLGNIYVTGPANGPPNDDITTIKYSPSGQQIWLRSYNGPANGSDGSEIIKIDKSENIIIAGESTGIGTGKDIVILKYTQAGTQEWVTRYSSNGNHDDYISSMEIDESNCIYLTGQADDNYITLKYNNAGIQRWASANKTNPQYGVARSLSLDNFGNVFVTGESVMDSINSTIDIVTIKYDSLGREAWIINYNGPLNDYDYAFSIGLDKSGSIYVTGGSTDAFNYWDYVTIKYDSSGHEQWSRIYSGTDNYYDQSRVLVIDHSNNIYVTGYSTEIGRGYDFTTIKYNTNGDLIKIVKYNNGLNDMAEDMTIDSSNNIYVTGSSDGNGTGPDYATVKYDSSGNQIWVKRYDYSGQYGDYPQAIAVDNNGSVFVTGQSNRDFLTIKYSQPTGSITNFSQTPNGFELEQNFPNPFNPNTVVSYQLPVVGFVSLKVYDVLGNEVVRLVNVKKPAGSYEVGFKGDNLPSGIYFYRLEVDGNLIDTKKMLLLK